MTSQPWGLPAREMILTGRGEPGPPIRHRDARQIAGQPVLSRLPVPQCPKWQATLHYLAAPTVLGRMLVIKETRRPPLKTQPIPGAGSPRRGPQPALQARG